jgi:DNA-binding MarR family transcriptional regulator
MGMDENLRKDAREIVTYVRRMRVGYMRYMTRDLERLGLTIPQYTALAILEEKGEMAMGAISEDMGVTMGAGTNIVDKLLRGGFASRERDTGDRRVVTVRITDKGRQVLERVMEWTTDYLGFYLSKLDPEERKSYVRIYGKMSEGIRTIPYNEPARG